MTRYFIVYTDDDGQVEREFASKAAAFRWFNWECPADVAHLQEETPDGRRGVPKTLRRRDAFGPV